MDNVVILSGVRTPIGAFQGALGSLTAPQLGATAIQGALAAAGVDAGQVDEVLMGNVLSAAIGQAPARQAALGAGLPQSVPCTTINKVCGSGMKAVMMAAQAIALGDAQVVVAGGMESMTNAPYALPQARAGYRMGNGTMIDLMINDGLWDPYKNVHMGTCGDACATEFSFSREELDAYSAESYRRALAAQTGGQFKDEIVPVAVPQRKGDPVMVDTDEEPGRGNPAKLPELRPAFSKEGVTTAGNASSINDGAAAMVLASEAWAQANGKTAIGRVVGYVQHAQAPEWFTTAPAAAIQKLLDKHGLTVADVDLFEVNEAFAVVAMYAAREVGIPHEKLNVNGGAVSIGHPIGMTGARLVLTALHELRRRGGRYAIATPCIGGGEATAVLIEAL
ncbi:MAG TPA: thiolase family protein [Fimbriimonadaceae bacterium]|nr:thiolase family protein [Fimbriimonadaceae bacterium]HRE93656.1 thiolase family protein [Fimbriimonadaceae bacterium]HRI73759.1 thiolase family protein [Fimbriimonadaceae bacterium]